MMIAPGLLEASDASDPWPNIQNDGIIWRDETHTLSTTFTQLRIRVSNTPGSMYQVENTSNSLDPFLDAPIQWAGDVQQTGGDVCSFRWVADLGPTSLTAEGDLPFNTWLSIGVRTARLINADVGTTKTNTSVFQIARSSDLSTIIGQASKTLVLTRTV
jgi:hypothetical protein